MNVEVEKESVSLIKMHIRSTSHILQKAKLFGISKIRFSKISPKWKDIRTCSDMNKLNEI